MELEYSLHFNSHGHQLAPPDQEAASRMRTPPPNWSLDYDEDLALFMGAHVETESENLGCVKNYVEFVEVSTSSVRFLPTY